MSTNGFHDDDSHPRSLSEPRASIASSQKRSNSEDHLSAPMAVDEEEDQEPQQQQQQQPMSIAKPVRQSLIPKPRSIIKKGPASISTPRPLVPIPPISRRAVQGVLVRFFRNGDGHHPGVQVAINELELKSWEAFLNYLNRQPKLILPTGGIKHVYTMHGSEIRSMNKFQHRQSYVVASGGFIKTSYQHMNDVFNEELETGKRWRSPPMNGGEQLFIIPFSRLNLYETMILNRNVTMTFEQWLQDQVTDLLLRFTGTDPIRHLYAVAKFNFNEVKSFSQLFNMLKVTDTFIACTDEEFKHANDYLATVRPSDFLVHVLWPRKSVPNLQKFVAKPVDEVKLSLSWIYGYEGIHDQTKTIHTISDHEILYVMGSIAIISDPFEKEQRFYTKHNNAITCLTVHSHQPWVASSEISSSKDRSKVLIHVWNHQKLEMLTELRREQFGSDLALMSFSPRIEENLLLVVSREKPKILLIVDWKRNELIHSITCKSDRILSAQFIFNTVEWITCITTQHVLFYQIQWQSKPIRLVAQREAEVQNIYTGAVACDLRGERLVIGDKVGSIHIWRLVNNEPKLTMIKEHVLESDVHYLRSINPEQFLLANGQNQIKIWNVVSHSIDEIRCKEKFGAIQSITSLRRGLIIGTRLNYMLYHEPGGDEIEIIMRGHTSPVVSVCYQKSTSALFSVSADRYLFKWNHRLRCVEWSVKCPQLISCADSHPERNIILLGTETSKLLIYDTLSSFYVSTIVLNANTGVKVVRFSPNGTYLAVGLQNGQICVFDVLGNGDIRLRQEHMAQNVNVPITDVIWSMDSSLLLVVDGNTNYQIWSIPNWNLVKEKNMHLIQWQSLSHPVTSALLDKTIVDAHSSAIVLSPSLVLCCGKDGQLRLFRSHYERHFQTFQIGLGPVQSLVPSSSKETFFLSIVHHPSIVELDVNIN